MRPETSTDDAVLAQLVGEVAEAIEARRPIDWPKYAAEWPQYVAELRQMASTREAVVALGPEDPTIPGPSPNDHLLALGTLGDFRLIREIGRGGMGVVYEADQISLGRRVALKILPLGGMMDPRQLQRFKNEARTAATLSHPHIVSVISVGCERGLHYFAMQYVEGRSLAQIVCDMRKREASDASGQTDAVPVPISDSTQSLNRLLTASGSGKAQYFRRVAALGIQAARALDHAHRCGVVHRDVKPSNLLLDNEGKLWVADFGLASTAQEADLTITGDLLGTLRYMSPEQIRGERAILDHRTDVYSLGVTLYELLTLRQAFPMDNRHQLLSTVLATEPPRLRKVRPAVPADLETIVFTAIQKDPAARYPTAEALALDLERFLDNRPIQARPARPWETAIKWARRRPAWAAFIAVCIAACVMVMALQFRHGIAIERALSQTEALRREGLKREGELRAQLYSADLTVAGEMIERNDPETARELLLRYADVSSGIADVRGPEWQYLLRKAQQAHQAVPIWQRALHQSPALALAVSADGLLAASGDATGRLKIWSPHSGSVQQDLPAHEGEIRALIFSPDGLRLYSAGQDRQVQVWDTRTWKALFTSAEAHNHTMYALALNRDGSLLLSAARDDGGIKLWRTSDMSLKFAIDSPQGTYDVAFSPDERHIITVHTQRTVCRWDATDGRLVDRHERPDDPSLQVLQVVPERSLAIAAGYGDVVIRMDLTNGSLLPALHTLGSIYALAWSSSNKAMLLATGDGRVGRWSSLDSGTSLMNVAWHQMHSDQIDGVAWLLDGSRFLTICRDGSVALWDVAALAKVDSRVMATGKGAVSQFMGLAFSDDGRWLATVGKAPPVQITNARTGSVQAVLQTATPQAHLHFAAGNRLLVGSLSGALGIWDVRDGNLVDKISFPQREVADVTLSPNRETAAITLVDADNNGSIAFVDLPTKALSSTSIPCIGRPLGSRYAPDGKQLLVIYKERGPELVDLTSDGVGRRPLDIPPTTVLFTLSPDGKTLAYAARSNVYLFDLEKNRVKQSLSLFGAECVATDIAWSPDGRLLAIASSLEHVQLWHVPTFRKLFDLNPLDGTNHGRDVRFSANGQLLAIGLDRPDDLGNTLVVLIPLSDSAAAAFH